MSEVSIGSDCQISVSKRPGGERHIRSHILEGNGRKLWVSTVVLTDYPGAMAETIVFDVSGFGSSKAVQLGLDDDIFDRYKTRAEAVKGHKRAIYGSRRMLSGKKYTPKPRTDNDYEEVEFTPQQAVREVEKKISRRRMDDTIPFKEIGTLENTPNGFLQKLNNEMLVDETLDEALEILGDSLIYDLQHPDEDITFDEAMRRLASTPGLEESNLPENLHPDFRRFRSDK